jgi:NAD(P)-dependent dehydrogenase (short-subunit alcohol dehydrogenase family)
MVYRHAERMILLRGHMGTDRRARGLRALIVGASSGIGQALAGQLAESGARVVACARRRERIEAAPDLVALECDVRDPLQCDAVVAEASRHLGGLDALVYCAALSQITPLDHSGIDEWYDVFATNLFGAALVTRAALPHLCASDSQGRALFLTSDASDRAYPGLVAYSASKSALGRFCQGLESEFPQLKVSEVIVGPTAGTEIADHFDPTEFEKWATRWFAEGFVRFGMQQPDDVAALIVDAMVNEAPSSRIEATGPVELSATSLDEGRRQAEQAQSG